MDVLTCGPVNGSCDTMACISDTVVNVTLKKRRQYESGDTFR